MNTLFLFVIAGLLQFVGFIPFYLSYRKDCKAIKKENLAVSLKERFFAWCFVCPIWFLPIVYLLK